MNQLLRRASAIAVFLIAALYTVAIGSTFVYEQRLRMLTFGRLFFLGIVAFGIGLFAFLGPYFLVTDANQSE